MSVRAVVSATKGLVEFMKFRTRSLPKAVEQAEVSSLCSGCRALLETAIGLSISRSIWVKFGA
jgi:hypothetical protein